ncbi:hypothetical protein [Rhodovibrio salinarum]|uniref:Uncharacterized protein n=1 Tax=Rhodovibrio salinarum TaxID=1087 RepID=A0A934QI91_9PROT|nr:hypothetical protein [Rhodovibrio salinarum]MBK1697055.1 hypothetical protein [Rhodovibrio salinarum]
MSLSLAALLALAGCASDGPTTPLVCPSAVKPEESAQLVAFDGPGRDLTDVRFDLQVTDVALTCELERDEDQRTLETELGIRLMAEKGPANREGRAVGQYYVAVTDPDGALLSRQTFDIEIELPGNQTRGVESQYLSPTIPVAEGAATDGYTIYVGLVLTPEQLRYNRANLRD